MPAKGLPTKAVYVLKDGVRCRFVMSNKATGQVGFKQYWLAVPDAEHPVDLASSFRVRGTDACRRQSVPQARRMSGMIIKRTKAACAALAGCDVSTWLEDYKKLATPGEFTVETVRIMRDPIPDVLTQNKSSAMLPQGGMRAYNSGLIRIGDRNFIARRVTSASGRCRIDIHHMRGGMNIWTATPFPIAELALPGGDDWQHEDARLFEFSGKVHVAYTAGHYKNAGAFASLQMLAVVSSEGDPRQAEFWRVVDVHTIPFGGNVVGGVHQAREKNWMFFVHDGALHFVYSMQPKHTVVRLEGYRPVDVLHTFTKIQWSYGNMAGGTPPLRVGDNYVTFFHGSVSHPTRSRRYYMAAYQFKAEPPFEPVKITRPLIWGSERDLILPNPSFPEWEPLVIFPVGLMRIEPKKDEHLPYYLVTAGVNDSSDVLLAFNDNDLRWQRWDLYLKPQPRRFKGDVETTDPEVAAQLLNIGLVEQ